MTFGGKGQPPSPLATSDEAGRFIFDQVCAGPVQINAGAGALAPPGRGVPPEMILHGRRSQAAQGGDTNIVLRLEYP